MQNESSQNLESSKSENSNSNIVSYKVTKYVPTSTKLQSLAASRQLDSLEAYFFLPTQEVNDTYLAILSIQTTHDNDMPQPQPRARSTSVHVYVQAVCKEISFHLFLHSDTTSTATYLYFKRTLFVCFTALRLTILHHITPVVHVLSCLCILASLA